MECKQYKDASSANTSRAGPGASNLMSSQYSSSSSTNQYGTRSQQEATYGANLGAQSSYGYGGLQGVQATSSTYQVGTSGGSQGESNLGRQGSLSGSNKYGAMTTTPVGTTTPTGSGAKVTTTTSTVQKQASNASQSGANQQTTTTVTTGGATNLTSQSSYHRTVSGSSGSGGYTFQSKRSEQK
jgi:hypothetical protein